MANVDAIVFVLDCNDEERFGEAIEKLFDFTSNSFNKKVPLLIFANKSDYKTLSDIEIIDKLDLSNLKNISVWQIQKCSAIERDGLQQGIDLLQNMIKNQE